MCQSTTQSIRRSLKQSLSVTITIFALAGFPLMALAKFPNDSACFNANSQQIKDKCAGAMPMNVRSIPEPAPLFLLGLGVVALWRFKRFRSRD